MLATAAPMVRAPLKTGSTTLTTGERREPVIPSTLSGLDAATSTAAS